MLTRFKTSNAALTAIKFIGITAMLIDHYNSFIKAEYSLLLYEIGRLALPLFVFVFVFVLRYNQKWLTRPSTATAFSVTALPPLQSCECLKR